MFSRYIICYMAYSTINHQLLRRQDKSGLIHVRPHPEWTKASEKSIWRDSLGYRVFKKKHSSIASKISIWVCLKMLCTPLYPMVLLIIIPTKWLFHWGLDPIFRHTHLLCMLIVFSAFQHQEPVDFTWG